MMNPDSKDRHLAQLLDRELARRMWRDSALVLLAVCYFIAACMLRRSGLSAFNGVALHVNAIMLGWLWLKGVIRSGGARWQLARGATDAAGVRAELAWFAEQADDGVARDHFAVRTGDFALAAVAFTAYAHHIGAAIVAPCAAASVLAIGAWRCAVAAAR